MTSNMFYWLDSLLYHVLKLKATKQHTDGKCKFCVLFRY